MGEGEYSEVWIARDQLVEDVTVVLKIYAAEKGMNEAGVHQYRQEYSRSQNFSHPHLLKISHFAISEGIAYQLMPFYALGTLSRLKEEDSFSERQVALVLSQIGSALAALHRLEPPVLHQDIKPDNIVISEPDCFLLASFGISSLPTQAFQEASRGSKAVTIAYSPPEAFERFLKTGPSGDVFSLGVTLFEMCTKTLPWNGGGGKALLEERFIPNLPRHYSAELNELLQACMSLNNFSRPGAEDLHLRGEYYLKTGRWNLPDKENIEVSSLKRLKPYLLAACISGFLILVGWAYMSGNPATPIEKKQQIGASGNKEILPAEDELLIDMLEYEKEHLMQRTHSLEEENKKLLYKDSVNTILLKKHALLADNQAKENKKGNKETQSRAIKNEKMKRPESASATTSKKAEENNTTIIPRDLEQQLNKISDPDLSDKERATWKNETLTYFSEEAVRILDETEGTPRQYSPGIFLNLLTNVPHTIVVKGVKRDQNKKVTELRLSMQTKM